MGWAKPGPGRPRSFTEAVGFADCPALLPLMALAPNSLRAPVARCVQTVGAKSEVVARQGARAMIGALLGASEARRGLPGPGFAGSPGGIGSNTPAGPARRAAPGRGDFCGDEQRSTGVGARTRALRGLTCRICLSAARSAQRVMRHDPGASSAVQSARSGDRRSMRFYGFRQDAGRSLAASNGSRLFHTAHAMRRSLRARMTTAWVLLKPLALRA